MQKCVDLLEKKVLLCPGIFKKQETSVAHLLEVQVSILTNPKYLLFLKFLFSPFPSEAGTCLECTGCLQQRFSVAYFYSTICSFIPTIRCEGALKFPKFLYLIMKNKMGGSKF